MADLDPVDSSNAAPSSAKALAKDPVCGMDVNPATARYKTPHHGKEYFFCSAGCLAKFQTNSEKILSSPPKPMTMTSGLVSLGTPVLVMPTLGMGQHVLRPDAHLAGGSAKDTQTYVCPMCPEVRQNTPGPCPKCGMALDPESPALPATKTEYTCPMHPEIVQVYSVLVAGSAGDSGSSAIPHL